MRRFFDRGRILRTRLFDVSRYSGYNGRQDGLPIRWPPNKLSSSCLRTRSVIRDNNNLCISTLCPLLVCHPETLQDLPEITRYQTKIDRRMFIQRNIDWKLFLLLCLNM